MLRNMCKCWKIAVLVIVVIVSQYGLGCGLGCVGCARACLDRFEVCTASLLRMVDRFAFFCFRYVTVINYFVLRTFLGNGPLVISDTDAVGHTQHDLELLSGLIYIISVKAINKAKLVASHETTGIRVDTTPPVVSYL